MTPPDDGIDALTGLRNRQKAASIRFAFEELDATGGMDLPKYLQPNAELVRPEVRRWAVWLVSAEDVGSYGKSLLCRIRSVFKTNRLTQAFVIPASSVPSGENAWRSPAP